MAEFNENNNNQPNEVVSGVEPVRKHNVAKTVGIVTAGIVVLAAGGSAIAYNVSDFVKNQVKLRFSSPENYYSWVNEKNSTEIASQISDSYREILDKSKNAQHSKLSLSFAASDELKAIIDENYDDLDDDKAILDNLNEITIGVDAQQNKSALSGNVYANLNGDEFLNLDMAVDIDTSEIFYRLPALSEQWVKHNPAELFFGFENTDKLNLEPESVISPEELESLIVKYSGIGSDTVSDVEIEKKEDVTVGDITVNYTVAETTIDSQMRSELTDKFCTAMKEDELLKSILVDRMSIITADEYDSEIDSLLEDENDDMGSDILRTYIDSNGDIRGFSIDLKSDGTDDVKLIAGKDGNKINVEALELDELNDDERIYSANLSLVETDGIYDGNLNLNIDGDTKEIDFSNVSFAGDKKYINADVVFSYSDYNDEEQAISLSLKSDGDSQKISSDIVIEDTNYGTLTVEFSSEDGVDPVIPDSSGAYDIMAEDSDFPKDYVDQDKLTDFIKNLYVKLGLNEDEALEYAKSGTDSIYFESYDDYEYFESYDDYDDYDYYDESNFNDINIDTDDIDLYWEDVE